MSFCPGSPCWQAFVLCQYCAPTFWVVLFLSSFLASSFATAGNRLRRCRLFTSSVCLHRLLKPNQERIVEKHLHSQCTDF